MHSMTRVFCAVLCVAAGGVLSAFGAVPTLSSPANGAELATLNGTTTKVGSQKWFFCGLSPATRMTVMNAQAGWNGYSANDKRYWTLRATMGNTYTDRPQATTFSWSGTGPFTLTIKRRDGSTFLEKTGITGTSLAVDNFEIAASYTWTVSNADGASTPRSFTTEDTVPRLLNGGRTDFDYVVAGYDDASGPTAVTTRAPHGVRDMGGYIGKDGRRGRQGLIVRNSAFESDYKEDHHATKYVNDANRAFWNEFLGIKTEIDLRENVTETKLTGSTLGNGVEYVCVPTIPSIKNLMKEQESSFKAGVKSVFKIFADSSKYPISFHCTHGKDRTGVIGFLLGCVLDYNLDDIYADYEATIFWNPKQTVGIAGANGLVGYLNDYWTGSTVQEKAVNFIKGCGINDTQLNAIREIMLEPLPTDDVPAQSATFTVNGYKGASTLTDYPVLVRLAKGTLANGASATFTEDGADLRAYDASGNEIPHEIETWDPSGESTVWVRLPKLYGAISGQKTTFTLTWGGEPAARTTTDRDVWAGDYGIVLHGGLDASNNLIDAVTGNAAIAVGGTHSEVTSGTKVGRALTFDNTSSQATIPASCFASATDYKNTWLPLWVNKYNTGVDADYRAKWPFTISGWYNLSSYTSGSATLLRIPINSSKNAVAVKVTGDKALTIAGYSGYNDTVSYSKSYPLDTSVKGGWVHLAISFWDDGQHVRIAVNGVPQRGHYTGDISDTADGQPFYFAEKMKGQMDELRISRQTQTPDRLLAEYETMADPSFCTGVYGTPAASVTAPTITAPANGAVMPLQTSIMKELLGYDAATYADAFSDDDFRSAAAYPEPYNTQPALTYLEWSGSSPSWEVHLYDVTDAQAEEEVTLFANTVTANRLALGYLKAGRSYRWTVKNTNNQTATGTFSTEADAPRPIYVSGKIANCRDMGGWTGLDGRKIRQGLAYRSSGFDDGSGTSLADADSKRILVNVLGIKTDIDTRGKTSGASPLGSGIKVVNKGLDSYGGWDDAEDWPNFVQVFKTYLNTANYPIVLHCQDGQDRTGCAQFILGGLLGMSDDDLMRDYMWSCLWRNDFNAGNKKMPGFLEIINTYSGSTYAEKSYSWATAHTISAQEIATFRSIMLEPAEQPIEHTHVWSDWTTNPAPTCVTAGTRTHTCTAEGCTTPAATESESVPKLGHTSVAVAAVAATYGTPGRTAGTKCSVCGEILSGCTETPKLTGSIALSSTVASSGEATVTLANVQAPVVLSVVYGNEDRGDKYFADADWDGGGDAAGWDAWQVVGYLPAGATSATYTIPNWGVEASDGRNGAKYARFILTPAEQTIKRAYANATGTNPATQWIDTGIVPTGATTLSLAVTLGVSPANKVLADTPSTQAGALTFGLSFNGSKYPSFDYAGASYVVQTAVASGDSVDFRSNQPVSDKTGWKCKVNDSSKYATSQPSAQSTLTTDGTLHVYGLGTFGTFSVGGSTEAYFAPAVTFDIDGNERIGFFETKSGRSFVSQGGTDFVMGGLYADYHKNLMANVSLVGETETIVYSVEPPVLVSPAHQATLDIHFSIKGPNGKLSRKAYLQKSRSERMACYDYLTNVTGEYHVPGPAIDDLRFVKDGTSELSDNFAAPGQVTNVFSWTGIGPFSVTISNLVDKTVFFTTSNYDKTSIALQNFEIARKYRWIVSNASGRASRVFTTSDLAPRYMAEPAGKVAGIRDLGGRIGLNGRRVRQNLLFRCSQFSEQDTANTSLVTDPRSKEFWCSLGIKTDLDLRGDETTLTSSPLKNVTGYTSLVKIQGVNPNFLTNRADRIRFATMFNTLSSSTKYPLAFHCKWGKDRTGTLAMVLLGVLGCDEDEIRKDWEATFFWTKGLSYWENYNPYESIIKQQSGSTFSERVYNFLTTKCNVTDAQITDFRNIMLEPEGYGADAEDDNDEEIAGDEPGPVDPSVATVAPAVVAPDGVTVQTHTSAQTAFMALDQATRRTKFCDTTYRTALAAGSRPLPTELSWTGDGSCTVVVKDAANATVFTTNLIGNAVLVDNLQIGAAYTWSVTNGKGSANGSFTTDATAPRLLRDPATQIDATADGDIFNVRAFGGRTGLDGKRVKTGLLFRSSAFDANCQFAGGLEPSETYVTDANRTFYTGTLGIKTDVDLRNACEYGSNNVAKTTGPLGAGVEWVHFHGDRNIDAGEDECPQYGDFHKDWGKAQVKKFLDVFLDPAKYPVDFHCTSGQDRTGCFAFLLGGLLGVDENSLSLDWELLALHNATAGLKSGAPKIDAFVSGFAPYAGATLQEKIEAYVKGVGVIDDQITAFRNLMLEGGYEPVPAHTHVWSAWTTNPAPTCVTAGTRTHVCTAAGCSDPAQTETEDLPAFGHDWVTVPGKPATTTETGLTDGIQCSRCLEWQVEQRVIPVFDPDAPVEAVMTNAMANGWGYIISGLAADYRDVALVFTNTTAAMDWTLPDGVTSVRYLLVGGGGAGGSISSNYSFGGYGGAGGEVVEDVQSLTSSQLAVVVGAGGVKSASSYTTGGDGGASTLTVNGSTELTADGGAGGLGGTSVESRKHAGNGGNGAGGDGAAYDGNKGGAGGSGKAISILDDTRLYGAGGGGGASGTASAAGGAGGATGGGKGGKGVNATGASGSAGTDGSFYGAGGGGSGGAAATKGGNGYRGLVIVRYTLSGEDPTPVEHTHVWVEASRIEPTCEEAGSVTSNCTGTGTCELGGTKIVTLPALGHAWVTVPGTPATTTSTGLTDGVQCSRCHEWQVEQQVIPMLQPEPSARTVTAGEATGGKMTLTFGAGTSDLLLFAVWGATDVGDAFHLNAGGENGWDGFAFVARISAATTSYEYTLPSGWGTTVKYVRFFMTAVDEAPVASLVSVSGTDGAAVLDTGYVPTTATPTIAAYVKTPAGTRNQKIFEVGTEGANDPYLVCDMYVNADGKPAFNCRNSSKTSGWGCNDEVNSAVLEFAEAMRWQLACGTPQGRYDNTKDDGANPGDVPTAPANGTVKFYGVGEITQATVMESTYVHYLKPAMVYDAAGRLVAGFYDSITHKAFASATETPFTAGDAASYARDLLNGVTYYGDSGTIEYVAPPPPPEEHDYDTLYRTLQTDGAGYILTDYVPANLKTVKVEIKARKLNTLVGFYYMANANTAALAKRLSPNGNELGLGFWASAQFDDGMAPGLQYYCEPGTVIFKRGFCDTVWAHTLVTEGATVTVDGETCTTGKTPKNESAGGPIALFCCSMNGSTAHHVASLRVQYVRVWEGDTLVRDWVPATKNGVATLYDKVHDKCETVLGGTFTADDELDPDYADKPANSWTREPSMSASYAAGTAPTFDIGEALYGSPVATYTAAQLAMLDGGVYTQVVKVAETDEYRELAKTVVFTVTGMLPREASVAPAIVWPNGETVLTHTALQRAYLAMSDTERRNVYADAEYRQTLADGKSGPLPTALTWTGDGISTVTVTRVTGAEKQFLQREIVSVKNVQNVLEIENLEIGTTYRWTVANALGTATGTFTTDAEAPRLLRDPGPDQIRGIRDLGGRTGLDGKRVRQGLVFRSSQLGRDTDELNFINDVNRSFWADFLGIRTELDFRGGTENPGVTKSPIGDGVNYYKWPEPTASYGFDSYDSYRKSFALFLDRNNYPIDFHCAAGQDRTGVFAFLLNALLGVSEDELQKDWEVTAFWNSSVGFCFENYDRFRANLAAAGGANACEQAENYVINKLKFTMNDINTFRGIMLEDAAAPEPTENSWTAQPSIEPTRFEEGTLPALDLGATAYGTPTANYTAEQIAEFAAGDYTFKVWVDATADYTGLTNEIPFTVTAKVTPPVPPVTDEVKTNAMETASWGYAITGLGDDHRDVALVFTNAADKTMNWTVPENVTGFEFLVVGGGGSGGGAYNGNGAGGGGAGAMAVGTVAGVVNGTVFGVVVGAGGASVKSGTGKSGSWSKLSVADVDYVLAAGGGGGGARTSSTSTAGLAGGSGGGGGSGSTGTHTGGDVSADSLVNEVVGAIGTVCGNKGGTATSKDYGAGGGGASAAGGAKVGGDGLTSAITGEEVCYAGGGGGGCSVNSSSAATSVAGSQGGKGGGGQGGSSNKSGSTTGKPGKNGLGAGGGGGGYWATSGGNGGSGVVIIRYTAPQGEDPEPKEGWSEDPSKDGGKAASDKYPQIPAGSVLASVGAGTLGTWAKAKSVDFAEFMADPDSFEKAFLLDCAVSEVEVKEAEFRFTEIVPGVQPTIGKGGKYGNGKVVVCGVTELSADADWQPADDDSRFFKAKLVPMRYDENLGE